MSHSFSVNYLIRNNPIDSVTGYVNEGFPQLFIKPCDKLANIVWCNFK